MVIVLIKDEKLEAIAKQETKNNKEIFDKAVALELLDERKRIIELLNRRGILCVECSAEKMEYTVINLDYLH